MLILPLHKPLNLATLPLVTMLLVVANAMVYFGWQLGDADRIEAAQAWYRQSGLGGYEVPAYEKHLRLTAQRDALAELEAVPDAQRAGFVGLSTLNDVAFVAALEEGRLFESAQQHAAWRALRRPYQARLDEVFTLRHVMRSSEWSPARMLSSAFLHGGFMHLFGNMLFLVILGLLLEGALGGWRFLGVYLLGAFGASLASLWWRWGEGGSGLGASGAIAAVMGAFCVVWGRRPVRFFYWFGVVFDYVRAPAIWLLPLWLGWEVYNLLANADAGIGFDAHAGGLVAGAALGGLLVLARQVREDYMADDAGTAAIDGRWEQARQHMGRLENAAAERLLAELAAEQPQRLDVAVARYRVACNAGRPADMQARALDLLLRLDAGGATPPAWPRSTRSRRNGWRPARRRRRKPRVCCSNAASRRGGCRKPKPRWNGPPGSRVGSRRRHGCGWRCATANCTRATRKGACWPCSNSVIRRRHRPPRRVSCWRTTRPLPAPSCIRSAGDHAATLTTARAPFR